MPNIGDTITCTETGKTFVVAKDCCSYNYALGVNGEFFSDEGVDIAERGCPAQLMWRGGK
jgi:hypothetical protein